jgi:DNA-binding transcriptional LysR family regulator
VTQSAITQALEAAFGRALVARGRRGQRGVSLLPAGNAALMHLRVARHEMEAAAAAAADPGTLLGSPSRQRFSSTRTLSMWPSNAKGRRSK